MECGGRALDSRNKFSLPSLLRDLRVPAVFCHSDDTYSKKRPYPWHSVTNLDFCLGACRPAEQLYWSELGSRGLTRVCVSCGLEAPLLPLAELCRALRASAGTTADGALCREVPHLPAGEPGLVLRAQAGLPQGDTWHWNTGTSYASCWPDVRGQPGGREVDPSSWWEKLQGQVTEAAGAGSEELGSFLYTRLLWVWGTLTSLCN